VTQWYKKWQTSGWQNSTGNDVINQDLIKLIRQRIEKRDGKGTKTEFTWVKGHASDEGNIGADLLAVEGSRMEEVEG
jgi:ribonuclease HI